MPSTVQKWLGHSNLLRPLRFRKQAPGRPLKFIAAFFTVLGLSVAAQIVRAAPIEILFVGNSFTHGRYDPVRLYNAANVHDLNCPTLPCTGNEAPANGPPASLANMVPLAEPGPYGGIPGIFKKFTTEAGLNYNVSIDTISSATLGGFFTQVSRRTLIADAKWDTVVLQEQSFTPLPAVNLLGNPTRGSFSAFQSGANNLTAAIDAKDATAGKPNAKVYLYETQPLASYTYASTNPNAIEFGTTSPSPPGSLNSPYVNSTNTSQIEWVGTDLHDAYFAVAAQNANITGVAPGGDAWIRAIEEGIAQRNPYLAVEPAGQIDLWDSDSDQACCTTPIGYHPSSYGAFLNALVLFDRITGIDPRTLGGHEQAAVDLGITPTIAASLERVAFETVSGTTVPEPPTLALFAIPLLFGWRLSCRR